MNIKTEKKEEKNIEQKEKHIKLPGKDLRKYYFTEVYKILTDAEKTCERKQ